MPQPPTSRLRLEHIEGVMVVQFVDDKIVSDDTIDAVADELFRLVEQAGETRLLLNMRGVQLISSSALASLMTLDKKVKERRGLLKLCGLQKLPTEVFHVTGLDRVFEIHVDEPSALDAF